MTSHQEGPAICKTCRGVDFTSMPLRQKLPAADRKLRLVHRRSCDLCAILTPNSLRYEKYEMYWYPRFEISFSHTTGTIPAISFEMKRLKEYSSPLTDVTFYVPTRNVDREHASWQPKVLSKTPDYAAARAWLNKCQTHHELSCNQPSPPQIPGMYLIDVHKSTIVKVADLANPRWITLSCSYWFYITSSCDSILTFQSHV